MTAFRTLAAGCLLAASIISLDAQAPAVRPAAPKTRTQRYLEIVSGNEVLSNAAWGILAVTMKGDTVAAWNPGMRMIPASNMKLITTGAALHALGADFKYETRICCDGPVEDGVLKGDLYIVGGGDPTTASADSVAVPRIKLWEQWKGFLDKAGIKKIAGRVIGDGRYFDGPIENDTWESQDLGTDYGTGGDGLCFYRNVQEVKVSAGASPGDEVKVSPSFPDTPWMVYKLSCRTGPKGTGDNLYLFNSDVFPYAEIRGTFAVDRKPKTEYFSNKFGAYTCASYFCDYLRTHGIPVEGGAADVRMGRIRSELTNLSYGRYAAKVDGMQVLGRTYSPPLWKIARETNHRSDNFYAETMLRTLGRRGRHSACYDSSRVAVREVLAGLGAPADGVRIEDGSGLSRKNYISPSYLVGFLRAMMDSPAFEEYAGSLPQPGTGTLASRLKDQPEDVKGRFHMKSGSMNGVLCYSGYLEPRKGSRDETIVFSLMTNNVIAPTRDLTPIIDMILSSLASEN